MTDTQPSAAAPEAPAPEVKDTPPPPMPADFRSVLVGLESKVNKERELLMHALNDPKLIRDFATFNDLVRGMQASIRAIDVLVGRTDLLGQPIVIPSTNVDPEPPKTQHNATALLETEEGQQVERVPIRKPEAEPHAANSEGTAVPRLP
ncbi:hypothetical protein [Hyphomicrobium sp. ghe19]|uniref:hypothetical protein n=1 Tax=Hyphomicrobium sp. ghe19 TaxID=2682968 RepID=UPI0013678ADD|nr:hypothetical protein HYPP_02454 [Hyphomicrobium sp. ghe19]